jgi:hypothetical protein
MSKRWADPSLDSSRRAPRFALAMPIQYRALDDLVWLNGQIENISRSGVIFRGERGLPVSTTILMRFELPADFGGEPGAQVICCGEVVRAILPPAEDDRKVLAARILEYTFVRTA